MVIRYSNPPERIPQIVARTGLPAIYFSRTQAEAGGLMSYGPTLADYWGRAAYYIDRLLKGAKPSELPIEQVSRFNLTINLRTAKAIGITFPESVLVRADQVIK